MKTAGFPARRRLDWKSGKLERSFNYHLNKFQARESGSLPWMG